VTEGEVDEEDKGAVSEEEGDEEAAEARVREGGET
jgi:hypothetical protein